MFNQPHGILHNNIFELYFILWIKPSKILAVFLLLLLFGGSFLGQPFSEPFFNPDLIVVLLNFSLVLKIVSQLVD